VPARLRRWYVWLPISALLLGLVLWRSRPWEIGQLWSRLDLLPLLLALALNPLVIVIWAVRSRSLMGRLGDELSLTQLAPVVSLAHTVNNLTPASTGEILRALILRDRYGISYSHSTAVIVIERFWALGVWTVTAAAAALGTLLQAPLPIVAAGWLAAIVASFTPVLAYRWGLRPGPALRRLAEARGPEGRFARLAQAVAGVDDALALAISSGRTSLMFVATTSAVAACFAIQLSLVLMALGVRLDPVSAWAVYGLGAVAGILSGLPFGLGATDVVITLLLGVVGVPVAVSGASVLLLRAVQTLPLGIAGTISWSFLVGSDRARNPPEAEDQRKGFSD
jgi:uncharacterized protein (TIRG00374 family)